MSTATMLRLMHASGEIWKLVWGWRKMTLRWGLFFFVLAAINEIVWRNFSDDFWVAFKVWGIMPLTMVFAISQLPLLNRYAPHDEPAPSPVKTAAEGAQTEV